MSAFKSSMEDEEEAQSKLYDRQIRLWGQEAQSRMQSSRVLVCGFRGLHCEVVKNIVLAGISVVIQDSQLVQVEDLSANFFFTAEDIGVNRANAALARVQDLNGYTSVAAETRSVDDLPDDYFRQFSVVLTSEVTEQCALRINALCRTPTSTSSSSSSSGSSSTNTVFFWSGCFATEGWFICDFGDVFEYKNDPPNDKEIKAKAYPSLKDVLRIQWKDLVSKHFPISDTFIKSRLLSKFQDIYSRSPIVSQEDAAAIKELSSRLLIENGLDIDTLDNSKLESLLQSNDGMVPVITPVIGGFLAQEVMKGVSRVGEPMRNIFVFTGEDCIAKAFPAIPK
jgi:ubiquitin-like 1-activating enzyme E1 A